MKSRKRLLGIFVVVILIFLFAWDVLGVSENDPYNYEGYIASVDRTEKNKTKITAISGDDTIEFVLKWYSIQRYHKDTKELAVGDKIMLSTMLLSDTNVKKISVSDGYCTEGTLVYVNELPGIPFVLSVDPFTQEQFFVHVHIEAPAEEFEIVTGKRVRVYHTDPINDSSVAVVADTKSYVNDDSVQGLTAEEIAFIESKGYTVME